MRRIRPTARGTDIETRKYDAHVRTERGRITADVFDSKEDDPDDAWIDGDEATKSARGAEKITEFLRSYGFDVVVLPP